MTGTHHSQSKAAFLMVTAQITAEAGNDTKSIQIQPQTVCQAPYRFTSCLHKAGDPSIRTHFVRTGLLRDV